MKSTHNPRRQFLVRGAAAMAAMPLIVASGSALAATNGAMRTSLKYQDRPEADKSCANCMQFVPGKTPKDLGGCKLIPNDTEVSPNAYCAAWIKKA